MKKKLRQFWNNCTKGQKYFLFGVGWFIGAILYIYAPSPIDLIFLIWGAFCGFGLGRVMKGAW